MNRSIAKTRNQLQRITLKINQLKTKYTGDVYLHSNPTIETSPIASHAQVQFRQIQKEHERSRQTRDPIVSGFSNKQSQSTAKNLSHNSSQVYCQPHCHNQSQASLGNEQLYQKQFKIFRNEIYNYIDRCIGGGRQRQEQIIQRMMEKYAQKQKALTHQNNKSKNNMQERIKKIQQQTTNCLTNIQDLLLQVKKNEKQINEKILTQETKFKKQVQEMNSQIRKISGFDADRISITIEQLHMKVMGIEKFQKQLRQQITKESKKLNTIDDITQQINIKIDNLQNRANKKIAQSVNSQEQIMVNKFQALSLEINKYRQFNVMLEKEILQLKAKLEQNQLQEIQNSFDESLFIKKMKQQLSPEFEQKIIILEENIHKNLADLASLAQSFLTLDSRLSETSSTLISSQGLMQACNQKVAAVSMEVEKYKVVSEASLKQLIISNFQDQRKKIKIEINEAQQKLKKNFNELISKTIEQKLEQQSKEKKDIQQALFDKLSVLINKHEAQIMSKIIEKEQKIIKVQQIQLMFNDLKNKLCEQIEAQISHTLALHEQNLIEKIKSEYLSTISGEPMLEFEEIEISIQNRILSEVGIRMNNFKSEMELKLQEKYREIKNDKLNNIQCHHDDWSERMSHQIQNKVKKFIFDDENSIKFHINKVEQKVQEFFNNFQASQRLGTSVKQNKIEDNQAQSIRRNDTLQSSQIGSQGQKNSPKLEQLEQKKVSQLVEEKLTQFESDINETIKLLYQDIENKVNEMLHQSGIMEFRNHFEIFKSEISSLSTLVNSLILMNETKTQQSSNIKNVHHELLTIKNQLDKSRAQIYSEMSIQIEKISTILERACEEVELKVQKLDQNFSYMYQRLSNIEYDNANFKDKLSYFLSQKVSTSKIQTKLIIESKSDNSENILDVLGKFSTGKKDFLES